MKSSIIILRTIHGLFTVYFLSCLGYLYYAAFLNRWDAYTTVAIGSLAAEGLMVFALNNGDCPLIHIQKRIGDPIPFFELIFPKKFAKKAIPFFSVLTFLGILLLLVRHLIG